MHGAFCILRGKYIKLLTMVAADAIIQSTTGNASSIVSRNVFNNYEVGQDLTIKDIARLSGVSVSTVSRVMNNHPDVSKEARQKVMQVVNETNYIPNNSARELSKTSTDNIGLIVRGISNPFYTKVLHEIEISIDAAGYTMVMQQIGATEDEILAGSIMAREKKLLGLILLGGHSDYNADTIKGIGVPFVCCTFDNSYGSLNPASFSSVSIDDELIAYEATKRLAEAGHKDVAMLLSGKADSSISQLRYTGYMRAVKDYELTCSDDLLIETGSYNIGDAYLATKKWLDEDTKVSAIFSMADNSAIGAMRAIREKGLSVPEDISIVAIDGLEVASYLNPPLSTYEQPMEAMGKRSVELLLGMINEEQAGRQIKLEASFIEGGTIKHIN